jgi:hypothetical protein
MRHTRTNHATPEVTEAPAEEHEPPMPEARDSVTPFVTTFPPAPHTPPVFRVLKQAYREWLAGGNAANINVTTPPTHTAASATVVAGTVEVAANVPMPPAVTVVLTQAAVVKGTLTPAVDPVTGAYSASFPGATCVAGTATATVSLAPPYPTESVTTPAFTLT